MFLGTVQRLPVFVIFTSFHIIYILINTDSAHLSINLKLLWHKQHGHEQT